MKLDIVINSLPAELRGKRAFIGHDFQVNDQNFVAYFPRVYGHDYGLPETEKLGDAQFEKMSEAWQWFWFDLLKAYAPASMTLDLLKKRWKDLTDGAKAFTNKHGSDQYHDYINGANEDNEPMAQENVTTCGNMVVLTGATKSIAGVPFLGIWCLDRSYSPPSILGHPAERYFIHRATVCRPEQGTYANFPINSIAPNGTFIVNPFHHNEGNDVPVPLVSARGRQDVFMGLRVRENWIASRRLVELLDAERPLAYVR